MEITLLIVGLIVGFAIGFLIVRGQKNSVDVKCNALTEEVSRLRDENILLKKDISTIQKERQELMTKCEVVNQKCTEQKESSDKEKNYIIDSYQRELESNATNNQKILNAKEEECKKAIETLKERYEQEIANIKEAHKKDEENWQKEKESIQSHNDEILSAQEKRHNDAIKSMKDSFNETIEHLKANLKAATEDMLKVRQEEFSDTNKKNMQSIVNPLNETIEKMKTAMEGYSKEQNEFSGAMKSNIDTIIKQTETARQSAVELTTALKHDSKVQGDYGEAILDEILSKQGFTEGVQYELQYTFKDDAGRELKGDDGKGLRPDVIVHLDTMRDVIIDSKVSLTDFINFANAESAEERKMYLEKHVKSIENQVKLLSQKGYFKYHKKTNARMDYVIMFVPISAAWWEALRYKPSLWREAMESNVYIADEQTLFAALRIINLTWTQIAQVKSQQEVFGLATEMIDRVGQFMKSYQAIGDSLNKAQAAFEAGNKKLSPNGQSILNTSGKLLKLRVPDSKKNPISNLIDVDDIEQLPPATVIENDKEE